MATQPIPLTVSRIPAICPGDKLSPRINQAVNAPMMGTRLIISMDNRGPIMTKAWKRNESPMTSPMMPDIPNQNHRSGESKAGKDFWVIRSTMARRITANTRRARLTITEPTRRPARVNCTEVAEKNTEVTMAAISPMYWLKAVHAPSCYFYVARCSLKIPLR